MTYRIKILLLAATLVGACVGPKNVPSSTSVEDMLNRDWKLVSVTDVAQLSGQTFSVTKSDEGYSVAGNSGCNRFFGSADVIGTILHVYTLASTRRACAPEKMQAERVYLKLLTGRELEVLVEAEKLKLKSAEQILLFE